MTPRTPWDFAPLSTGRLLLRPMTEGDVDDVLAYQSREDVTAYLPYRARTREQVATAVADYVAHTRLEADGDWIQPAIEVGGRVVGQLFLRLESLEHRGAEIGWVLHPDASGRGYATEGAAALLGLAFGQLGLHRVHARLDPRNRASIGVCRRLGMREEGLHRRDFRDDRAPGGWSDTGVWAILDEEWAASRAGAATPARPGE
jgi:RimJ/RimL family protein N-acetyltransferase